MKISVIKKEDGYWLSLDGKLKAAIHLGNCERYGDIVTAALEEAVQQVKQIEEGVFHMEYIDADTVRLTRLEKEKS